MYRLATFALCAALLMALPVPSTHGNEIAQVAPLAEAGDVDAQLKLGLAYRDGLGVSRDHVRALHWFQRAAKQNSPAAWDHVGWMKLRGYGTPRDFPAALKLFERAANSGFAQAQNNLGFMLAEGLTKKSDPKAAAGWWRKAAKQRHTHAAYRLAALGIQDRQDKQRVAEAIAFCQQAVEANHGEACLLWARIHDEGIGRKPDNAIAKQFWRRGHQLLKEQQGADFPRGMLSRDELRKAQRRAERQSWPLLMRPHQKQGFNLCAPTAAAILLSDERTVIDPRRIKSLCANSPFGDGTDWAQLVEAIKRLDYEARIVTYPVTEDGFTEGLVVIETELAAGRPLLIDIREPTNQSNSAHTVVLIGFDREAGKVYLHDPAMWAPGVRSVSLSYLRQVWNSRGYTSTATVEARPLILIR